MTKDKQQLLELIEKLTIIRSQRGRIFDVAGDEVDVALGEAVEAIQSLLVENERKTKLLERARDMLDEGDFEYQRAFSYEIDRELG